MMEGTDRWPPGDDELDETSGGAVGRWLELASRLAGDIAYVIPAFGQLNVLRQYHRLDEGDGEDRERSDDWGDLT